MSKFSSQLQYIIQQTDDKNRPTDQVDVLSWYNIKLSLLIYKEMNSGL